jgi:hypothetical protein
LEFKSILSPIYKLISPTVWYVLSAQNKIASRREQVLAIRKKKP